jgi:hypothetical protein
VAAAGEAAPVDDDVDAPVEDEGVTEVDASPDAEVVAAAAAGVSVPGDGDEEPGEELMLEDELSPAAGVVTAVVLESPPGEVDELASLEIGAAGELGSAAIVDAEGDAPLGVDDDVEALADEPVSDAGTFGPAVVVLDDDDPAVELAFNEDDGSLVDDDGSLVELVDDVSLLDDGVEESVLDDAESPVEPTVVASLVVVDVELLVGKLLVVVVVESLTVVAVEPPVAE